MNPRHKNILIVAHHYPPHVSGVGMVAHNHAKRLVLAGHSVTALSSDADKNEKSCVMDGVETVRVKALNFTETKLNAPFPLFSPTLVFALAKQVKKADIVHIHDAFYMSSFAAAVMAKLFRKPVALTQHVAMIAHPSKLIVAIQKIVYATTGAFIFRASGVIFVFNDRVKSFLLGRGVPESKMQILMNGVDTDLFRPASPEEKAGLKSKLGLDPARKAILFVGRLVPKKGFDKVLAAHSPEHQIVMAGCDPLVGDYPDTVFLGKMDQARIAEVYRACDIFVLPSESEGFPLSIQEAMAAGLPIISTDDEGYAMYGLDKKLMRLLDRPTAASVKDAILSVSHDSSAMREMSDYSRAYALERFSWPLIVTKLMGAYGYLSSEHAR